MRRKDMNRDEWKQFLQKELIYAECQCNGHAGKASLLKILDLSEPFAAVFHDKKMILADLHYSWVQLAMDNDFAWFTAMFDECGRFLQIYIDVTDGNRTDCEVPYFHDLFLDYVICENEVEELDRRELEDARQSGLIEEETYKAVCRHGGMIREYLNEHLDEVIRLMQEIHDILIQTDTDMENLPKLQIETVPQLRIRRKI